MSSKPRRLELLAIVDLPVLEASGVTARHSATGLVVLVVGDRTAELGVCRVGDDGELAEWSTFDLAALPQWPYSDEASQFESITSDGGSLVALMREDPPVVLVADTATRKVCAEIELSAPTGSLLDGQWDDPSSRGEGLVLLRGGRMLVAQEKRPRALIEFGLPGTTPRGLSNDDFLGSDESWDAPSGSTQFVPLSMWELKDDAKLVMGDISSITVGPDRSLWLLSDKSSCVARLKLNESLLATADRITEFDEVWLLPEGAVKPEGFVALDDGRVLVVMDTKSTTGNAMIVTRPAG